MIWVRETPPLAEERHAEMKIRVTDGDGDEVRVFVADLPPGARFDESKQTLHFRPDFTQGGRTWTATITATDGDNVVTAPLTIRVKDTIRPPAPTVVNREDLGDHIRLTMAQTTDTWLDSPGHAGRVFEALVLVPKTGHPVPVRVELHGLGGHPWPDPPGDKIRVRPFDPNVTYWWGYSERLPEGPAGGKVPGYTTRRVLHLLDWVLRTQPADPDRVAIFGGSMGGAGAKTIGLLHARHFANIDATIGQAIPRNHRPTRLDQLSGIWGRKGPVWDRLDLTRLLEESAEARDQFVFTHHGKDDGIIHFGAVVQRSPRTNESWYSALQRHHVGHYVTWDEGGHGPPDPVMGSW